MSPAYDVLDTTVYGRLSTEMGVPLSFDRLVTDVTRSDVTDAIRHAGYPENLAWAEFEILADDAVCAFPKACELVAQMGFADEVERLEGPMGQGLMDRASFSFTEGRRVSVDGQYQGKGEHKIR